MEQKRRPDWQSILEQAWGTVEEALIPRHVRPRHMSRRQVIWAIRIGVALIVTTLIIFTSGVGTCWWRLGTENIVGCLQESPILITFAGFVYFNAALVSALLALVGVLIA